MVDIPMAYELYATWEHWRGDDFRGITPEQIKEHAQRCADELKRLGFLEMDLNALAEKWDDLPSGPGEMGYGEMMGRQQCATELQGLLRGETNDEQAG